MSDALLVLNAGSSSLKLSVFRDGDPPRLLLRGQVEGIGSRPRFVAKADGRVIAEQEWPAGARLDHAGAIEHVFAWGRSGPLREHRIVAVGHRVVHGGARFSKPVRVDAKVIAELEALVPLAPLHQPHNVAAIRAVAEKAPDVPQVACFDTAFHATQARIVTTFALPRRFADDGVRRYGFHGLSYEYIAKAFAETSPREAAGRVVVAHLGNGASMCAMRGGKSVATTMSFTALDGLVMGTRCGSLDPGVVLHLMRHYRMDVASIERTLYEESGLLGVSGMSRDMRELLAQSEKRTEAAEAVDLFIHRIGRELGSLAAALGGIDAIVFTGGIGENAAPIRERVCRDASWLGVDFDERANGAGRTCITHPGSRVSAWVIPTNEELMIARHTREAIT